MREPATEVFSPIRWHEGHLELLDQTLLPAREQWLPCHDPETVAEAIRRLAVRGAPAIGVAAGFGLVLGLKDAPGKPVHETFEATFELLAGTRPTAVNLRWALEQGRKVFAAHAQASRAELEAALLAWALQLHAEDIAKNRALAAHGALLFERGDRVLTHCNAGALATAGIGTALGVIEAAWRERGIASVWVDETRPLLQGARLTAWELARAGIPFRLVTDSSVGALMSRGLVDRVVVGADRIAANGDTANKIGTYTVAVLAARHGVPFYVAAPLATIDLATPNGPAIPIEERGEEELTQVLGKTIAPDGTAVLNLAFDVTPHELIAGIVTEVGVLRAPYTESIAGAFGRR
jgi:methylthioribose-1-phosphate isomerase